MQSLILGSGTLYAESQSREWNTVCRVSVPGVEHGMQSISLRSRTLYEGWVSVSGVEHCMQSLSLGSGMLSAESQSREWNAVCRVSVSGVEHGMQSLSLGSGTWYAKS